jgi:hypothetical protein
MRMTGCSAGFVIGVVAVALLVSPGCGPANVPLLGLVSGTVTLNGSPLPNAEVCFNPTGGRMSSGTTDASGFYRLIYIETQQVYGALPGSHRVAIGFLSDVKGPKIPSCYSGAESILAADVKPASQVINWTLDDNCGK